MSESKDLPPQSRPRIRDLAAANMKTLWSRASRIVVPIAAVGGFVSDVLAPLGPILPILLGTTTVLCVISGLVWFGHKRRQILDAMANGEISREEYAQISHRDAWSVMFAFNLMASVVLMLFFGAQIAFASPEKNTGALAANFQWVSDFQSRLLKLQKSTERIEANTDKIEKSTERIEQAVADLNTRFDNLGKQSPLVAQPKTPEDHYQNARVFESRGDYMKARQSYLEYVKTDRIYLDPHLAFSTLLKLQDGRQSAVESYDLLARGSSNPSARLARALLLDHEPKIAELTKISVDSPEFAPTFYYLAKEYSSEGSGQNTIGGLQKEKSAYASFRKLAGRGLNAKYFLDKRLALAMESEVETRWKTLQNVAQSYLESPVKISVFPTGEGEFRGLIQIPEETIEIWARIPGETEFKSTGFSGAANPMTGKPIPQGMIGLGKIQDKSRVEVKYKDAQGKVRGPFEVEVNPGGEFLAIAKKSLTAGKMASISRQEGKITVSPAPLIVFRHAIAKAVIGPDPTRLTQTLNLPEARGPAGFTTPTAADMRYLAQPVPSEWQKVYLKIYYTDGSSSHPRELEN